MVKRTAKIQYRLLYTQYFPKAFISIGMWKWLNVLGMERETDRVKAGEQKTTATASFRSCFFIFVTRIMIVAASHRIASLSIYGKSSKIPRQ